MTGPSRQSRPPGPRPASPDSSSAASAHPLGPEPVHATPTPSCSPRRPRSRLPRLLSSHCGGLHPSNTARVAVKGRLSGPSSRWVPRPAHVALTAKTHAGTGDHSSSPLEQNVRPRERRVQVGFQHADRNSPTNRWFWLHSASVSLGGLVPFPGSRPTRPRVLGPLTPRPCLDLAE